MASFLMNFTTIMSLLLVLLPVLLVLLAPPLTAEEEEYYPVRSSSARFRARFLTPSSSEPYLVQNNTGCLPGDNVCDGLTIQPGTDGALVLANVYCCKNHCRNVLTDKNNCGVCQNMCRLGEMCCDGFCTNVAYNATHCGKCHKSCMPGQACEYGSCGYA